MAVFLLYEGGEKMKLKISDNVKRAVSLAGDSVNKYNKNYTQEAVKPLDRTYTGRIMSVNEDGTCKIMYDNRSSIITMADDNIHYINEIVRVYIPNGDINKAYAESVSPTPCSHIIVSQNQMVFKTTISAPIFSADSEGNPKVEVTEIEVGKVIELTRDSMGRPVSAVFPDKSEITVEYKD